MNEYLSLGIVGLYTIIYVIVFVAQRSQIKKIESINNSMTSFMSFFDLAKLKEYASIVEKLSDMKVDVINKEHGDKMVKLSKFLIDSSFDTAKQHFEPKINEMQSFILANLILSSDTMSGRKEIIEKYLPENKDSFIYLLDLLDKNRTV
jgi:alkyl hydroperoxide reductase subunit AhpF